MKSIKSLVLVVLFSAYHFAYAQSGLSGNAGVFIDYNEYVNAPATSGGDYELGTGGYLEIGANGELEVLGAMINRGTIQLRAGAKLTVFGNMLNGGNILVEPGATLVFLGTNWTNTSTARVSDELVPNTIIGGDVNFNGSRPAVSASWVTNTPYLALYGGATGKQWIDGGNIPFDVVLRLQNTSHVALVNSPTRIEGILRWDMANTHVELGDQNLSFTSNAQQQGFGDDRFAITNGSGHVSKASYTGSWIFPVGIAAGAYTPAEIDNVTNSTMSVAVQDYANSISDENSASSLPDGIDRTWNIYSDKADAVATVNLQHNIASDLAGFSLENHFVTRWSSADLNNTGDMTSTTPWQFNIRSAGTTGNLNAAGVAIDGTSMRYRNYRSFATNPNEPIAFYSKSTYAFGRDGADLYDLEVNAENCTGKISFKVGDQNHVTKYQLQHSLDGVTFATIATFDPKADSSEYNYEHLTPKKGKNYYRVIMLESTGVYSVSKVVIADIACGEDIPVVLYPNPATDFVIVNGMTSSTSEVRIINMHGRVMSAVSTSGNSARIDVSWLPAASYMVQVVEANNKISNLKLIKL